MPSRIWNKGRKDCFQLKLEIVILANNVYPDLLSYMILCPSAKRASMKRKVSLLKLLILIYLSLQHNRHALKDQVVFQCLLKTAGSCFPGPFKHVLVPVNASINKTTPWLVSTRQKEAPSALTDKLQQQIMNNYARLTPPPPPPLLLDFSTTRSFVPLACFFWKHLLRRLKNFPPYSSYKRRSLFDWAQSFPVIVSRFSVVIVFQ